MTTSEEELDEQLNRVVDQIWDSTDDTLAAELAQIGFTLLIDSIRIGTGDIDWEEGITRNPSRQAAAWRAVEPRRGLRASVFLTWTLLPLCGLADKELVRGIEALNAAYGSPTASDEALHLAVCQEHEDDYPNRPEIPLVVLSSRGALIATAGRGLANYPEGEPWRMWFQLEGLEWFLIESAIWHRWSEAVGEVRKYLSPA